MIPELAYRFNRTTNGLVIPEPTIHDAGNYKCYIPDTNEEATIEVVANAYVEPLPARINAARGTNVQLYCNVHGTRPKIEWTINGKEIVNNTRIKFRKDIKWYEKAILIIENIEPEDQNTYNCTATNKATEFELKGRKMYAVAKTGTYVRTVTVGTTFWGMLMKYLPFHSFISAK